jgi:type I restriction enzyme R subunit
MSTAPAPPPGSPSPPHAAPTDLGPLSEADTHSKLVNPAIYARGWTEQHIKREETTGTVEIIAGRARRRRRGRTDLTLRIIATAETQPVAVAVIEVKKNTLPPGHGLDQAKGYAQARRLNVPFVFSTNGYQFVEFDRDSGQTSGPRPMAEFPTPAELRARYEASVGFSLNSPAAAPLLRLYKGGEGGRRYYQDAAIRAVFEKVARDDAAGRPPRALLALATGSGKTFIAANLLHRVREAGLLKRALFLCDRDELRRQALGELKNYFGDDAREVYRDSDGKNHARNAAVHVATYQTLGVDREGADESFLTEFYPPDHFSHIIIDECHRSAWGKWSRVLKMNPGAVQIGLTATPRQLEFNEDCDEAREDERITADNHAYFGEPVYEYEIAQAMEDGYLAAMEIQLAQVDLDARGLSAAEIIRRNPVDATTGQPLTARQIADRYDAGNFEKKVILPDRVKAMCRDVFEQMLANAIHRGPDGKALGPRQKTIIFCASDRHADLVAAEMNNLFAACTAAKGEERFDPYAFKCTASVGGNDYIPDFRGAARTHFVATTVELLTTGVDVKPVRNVAFFKYVASPIAFYQMLGRGTRIDEPTGKLVFTLYDYTGATRLLGQAFVTRPSSPRTQGAAPADEDDQAPPSSPPEPTVWVEGFAPVVNDLGRFVAMMVDGRLGMVPLEEYRRGMAERLVKECTTLADFRARWIEPPTRRELIDGLVSASYSPQIVRILSDMNDYDLYDVLGEIGYGLAPRTRMDRALAFRYKQNDWLNALPGATRAAVLAVADQFRHGGTDDLENVHIFQTPEVQDAGGIAALAAGGDPAGLIRETKRRIFAA